MSRSVSAPSSVTNTSPCWNGLIVRAVYCYNHSQSYVSEVLGLAALYGGGGGAEAGGSLFSVDLRPQLAAARKQITASKTQLVPARARAGRLASAQQRLLRRADSTPLLSDQLEAHKRAVL